jgi:predicted SnoaL-like aldol condensation-catalyzing enzyme
MAKAKKKKGSRKKSTRRVPAKATRKTTRKPAPRRAAPRAVSERARLAANKRLVLTMYEKLIGQKDFAAARRYLGDRYIQHSPYATDGHEGIAAFVATFKRDFPNHRYDVKKVIAEGNYVVLHLHGQNGLHPHGESVVDFFRVEKGRVVEHWDVIQAIPETASNNNGIF